jgi:two-component system chemotaxis response regulator CheY
MLLDSAKPVLVVDPKGDAVPVITSLLGRIGAGPVERAENGEAALVYLNEHAPSLIISDWVMEPMSGADLIRALRAEKKTAAIPVMIATDHIKADEALEALELGADAIAIVPLLPRDFLKKIEAIPERAAPSPG